MKKFILYTALTLCAASMFILTACSKADSQPSDDTDGGIEIACERHTVTDWEITPETHSGKCTTCGAYFTEPHHYHEGSTVCEECGYDRARG